MLWTYSKEGPLPLVEVDDLSSFDNLARKFKEIWVGSSIRHQQNSPYLQPEDRERWYCPTLSSWSQNRQNLPQVDSRLF